jgi:integrase
VFRLANRQCERVLLTQRERDLKRLMRSAEVRGKVPYVTPHSTRHSFALYMLITLNELMDRKYGLTAAERRDFAQLYGDPWWLVKTLLGHRDVETTREHYLTPVTHLQLESILALDTGRDAGERRDDEGNMASLFAQLAKASAGIQDIDVLVDARPVAKEAL